MCHISRKSRRKIFSGYKIAIEYKGKYYSISTGIEYKSGPVPKLPSYYDAATSLNRFFNRFPIETKHICSFTDSTAHNSKMFMNNLTGLFVNISDAKSYFRNIYVKEKIDAKWVLLEITIDKNLHNGFYMDEIVLGSNIFKIEEKKLC